MVVSWHEMMVSWFEMIVLSCNITYFYLQVIPDNVLIQQRIKSVHVFRDHSSLKWSSDNSIKKHQYLDIWSKMTKFVERKR